VWVATTEVKLTNVAKDCLKGPKRFLPEASEMGCFAATAIKGPQVNDKRSSGGGSRNSGALAWTRNSLPGPGELDLQGVLTSIR
jgi:hypothetical protein